MSTVMTPAATARRELPRFAGHLVGPGDTDYDEVRKVYNAMIDRRPALIAQCASPDDVAAVDPLRAGPPAAAGGPRRRPQRRRARHRRRRRRHRPLTAARHRRRSAGPHGARRRRLHLGRGRPRHGRARPRDAERHHLDDRRRRPHARRRPRPPDAQVRAGHRQPARGRGRAGQRRARDARAPTEHPDLFWALRGGGGNFGVVTSFMFRLHEVGTVVAGPTFWSIDDAAEVLKAYREFLPNAPRELNGFFAFLSVPPGRSVPRGAAPAQGLRRGVVLRRRRGGRGSGDGAAARRAA